jgi:uncharacterized membrane protein YtjA (UPF0391 family)
VVFGKLFGADLVILSRAERWSRKHVSEGSMLKLALFFLLISLVAALFGYTGLAAASAGIAKVLFFIFIVIFLVLLIGGLMVGSSFW